MKDLLLKFVLNMMVLFTLSSSLVPFFLHILADATICINNYAGVFFQISLFSITVFLYTLLVRKKAVKKLIILDLVFGTLLSFAIDLYFALLLAIVLF